MTDQPPIPLKPGDEVEYDGRRCKVAGAPGSQYSDDPGPRVLLQFEELETKFRSPLVSQVRRVPPPVTDSEIPDAAVLAAARVQCGEWFDDLDGENLAKTLADVRAALLAALPHLTAERDTEITRLRAELAELRGKVAKRHAQWRLYGECGHEHSETEADVIWASEIGYVCEDGFERSICRECCTDAEDCQTEACAHDHATPCWPCETFVDVAAEDPPLPAVLRETPAPSAPAARENPAMSEQADVFFEGPETCFERDCEEYVDDEGFDKPEVERCSHIREVPPSAPEGGNT